MCWREEFPHSLSDMIPFLSVLIVMLFAMNANKMFIEKE